MKQDIGEEFTGLSKQLCHTDPFEARLILYKELGERKADYFSKVFTAEDQQRPDFIRRVCGQRSDQYTEVQELCRKLADQYLKSNGIHIGSKYSDFCDGVMGDEFVAALGGNLSFVDTMVAKHILYSVVLRMDAKKIVFKESERSTYLYKALMQEKDWDPESVCTPEFAGSVKSSAQRFLDKHPYLRSTTGYTFGWVNDASSEWHLFGDLITTTLFKCNLSGLLQVFKEVCRDLPVEKLPALYESTIVCRVTVDPAAVLHSAYAEGINSVTVRMQDLVDCEWVGALPHIFGTVKI